MAHVYESNFSSALGTLWQVRPLQALSDIVVFYAIFLWAVSPRLDQTLPLQDLLVLVEGSLRNGALLYQLLVGLAWVPLE